MAAKRKAEDHDIDAEGEPGKRWVTMSNALARAGHGLTLAEKRIICFAVSKLDSRQSFPHGTIHTTRISAAEYAETFGVNANTAYEQLQEAAKTLHTRRITFYQPTRSRKNASLLPNKIAMSWVGRVTYQEQEGWVEIAWWPELLPHLTDLRKQFTSYQLEQVADMRSIYSWRLLELLMSYESIGRCEIDITDFAKAMDATEKQCENFANLRRRMIEPAVHDLIEKDGWLIDWQPIKAGRRVAGLRFDFKRNPQQRLDLERPRKARQAATEQPIPPPAPVDQLAIETLAAQVQALQERLAMLSELGVRVIPESELAAAAAKHDSEKAAGNAALANLKQGRRKQPSKPARPRRRAASTDPLPPESGDPIPTITHSGPDDGSREIPFDA